MRRSIPAILALTLVAVAVTASRAVATHAAPARPDAVVVTMRYGAALRLAPSSDADISTVASCGAVFPVVDARAGWFAVSAANQVRWVGGARVADVAATDPDCSDAVTFQVNNFAMVSVPSGCLSLRDAPSRGAAYSECVSSGQVYQIQNGPVGVDGEDWFQVYSPDLGSGWVLADYLSLVPV